MGKRALTVARAIIQKGNRFLLVKQAKGKHMEGFWGFPGGKIGKNETPETALKREVKEETNLTISIKDLFWALVFENRFGKEFPESPYVVDLYFRCEAFSTKISTSDDAEEFAWVTLEEMKNYKLRSPQLLDIARELSKS